MTEKAPHRKVREATHAGLFYPEAPELLLERVDALLASCGRAGPAGPRAILSPHAGFEYAGDLEALAWKTARASGVARIVLLAPLHRSEQLAIILPESDSFSTPLGAFDVDREAIEGLMDCGTSFIESDIPHFEEHSIEIQLPFARRLFPGAAIVPILLGRTCPALVKSLATALRLVFMEELQSTLFVVSSDLVFASSSEASHLGSDHFLALIAKGDWEALVDEGESGRLQACGTGCVAGLLASGLAGAATLLGRHDARGIRETEDDACGEYAALAFY